MSDATLRLELPDEEATLALGRALARALLTTHPAQNVLLYGDLGAGKTTLVRALVEALPGGDEAQVSSPSFNIMNLYPTEPRTAHFDLYRLEGMGTDEALLEEMQDPESLVLVEWAQFLDPRDVPGEHLSLAWENAAQGRTIVLTAAGTKATQTVSALS